MTLCIDLDECEPLQRTILTGSCHCGKKDQPGTIKQISQVFIYRQDCEKWITYEYIKLYDSISEKQYDTELFSSFKHFWSYKANLWLCFVNFNESINYYNNLLVCLQNSFSLAHQNLFLKLFSLTKHLFLDSHTVLALLQELEYQLKKTQSTRSSR